VHGTSEACGIEGMNRQNFGRSCEKNGCVSMICEGVSGSAPICGKSEPQDAPGSGAFFVLYALTSIGRCGTIKEISGQFHSNTPEDRIYPEKYEVYPKKVDHA